MRKISFRILECYSNEKIERKWASEKNGFICVTNARWQLSNVRTNAAVLNDQDILAEVVGCVAESDDDEDESSDEPVAKPPISEVIAKAIEILEKFTLFSRSGEDLMSSLKIVNRVIHAEEQLSKKQSTINAYFRKEK